VKNQCDFFLLDYSPPLIIAANKFVAGILPIFGLCIDDADAYLASWPYNPSTMRTQIAKSGSRVSRFRLRMLGFMSSYDVWDQLEVSYPRLQTNDRPTDRRTPQNQFRHLSREKKKKNAKTRLKTDESPRRRSSLMAAPHELTDFWHLAKPCLGNGAVVPEAIVQTFFFFPAMAAGVTASSSFGEVPAAQIPQSSGGHRGPI